MTNKEIKDKILEEINIVDVVSEYVQLEKSGNNYKGLCPFHDDSTPSFHVSEEKKICKCFSCNSGGDVIGFLSKIENISHAEAIAKLAKRVGIEVKRNEEDEKLNYLYNINDKAKDFYSFCLNNTSLGEKALNYLKQRQIDEKIIEEFKIGLSSKENESLYKYLTSKKIEAIDMIELGLVRSKDNSYLDVFNSRIMFPISDVNNKIVGFSGRVFQGETNTGKYINSMETTIFKKSDVLYNLNNAKEFIKKKNRAILLEGFMDVIALYKADMKEAVCSMGTSLTINQAKLLKRYTNNVVICYDGDNAGKEATLKAIKTLKAQGLNIYVVNLPDNLDPDDYLKKYNKEQFLNFFNVNTVDENTFYYSYFKNNLNLNDLNSIEIFKENLFEHILTNIKSESLKDRVLTTMSKDINILKDQIINDFNSYRKRINFQYLETIPQEDNLSVKLKIDRYFNAERTLLKFMIENKKNFLLIENELEKVTTTHSHLDEMKVIVFNHYLTNEDLLEEDFILYLNNEQLEFYDLYLKNYIVNYTQINLIENIKTFHQYSDKEKRDILRKSIMKIEDIEERCKVLTELRKKNEV